MSLAESTGPAFDQAKAEAFLARVCDTLDAAAVANMLSIGHRTGLLDRLAALPPSTSQEIARAAGLAERYVREWLACLVTARIVAYDSERRAYALPPEHAACLTRAGALGNMAVYARHAALMGKVEEKVIECFRTGLGLAYDDYPCFHELMAEDSAQTVVAGLFDAVLPLAGDLVDRLEAGIDVLDAGCGRGLALIAMAGRFPASRFTGYDLCADAVADATVAAAKAGVANVAFGRRDLTGFDEREAFDLITSFDAVHDQRSPADLVRRLHAALRPGGVYLMQDIGGSARLENNLDFPLASFLYAISTVHCTPVSLGQGGEGLGTMWGWETAEATLREAGFASVERHVLPHDPMNVWFVARKA